MKKLIDLRKRNKGEITDKVKQKIKDLTFKKELGYGSRKEYLLDIFTSYVKRKRLNLSVQYMIYKLSFGILFATEENQMVEEARNQMLKDMDIHTLLNKI